MTTSPTNSNSIAPGHEPIAGYVLEELIGRGGFGEVWRAEAPGGMKKAVKFVFGEVGENRTQQELKSLERIKGVQHPFILGLERFEVVNNQLVVVTELAEGSLNDAFQNYRDRGSCGIPRAVLLTYMRDTADALDYMHQTYQLQHLDIKPANLLIVGGRVKVADFGLLKDLQDVECSLVGGLTPIYAPPELFDGKPSMRSDQYSLAVMYQELLTGTRPFTGRTIAQLATQHVHNAPNLEPLPPSDRPCVARALEKSPDRRFGSCSEFVAALTSPRQQSADIHGRPTDSLSGDTKTVNANFLPGAGNVDIKDLPELASESANQTAASTSHALVVAIGGVAAECVGSLIEKTVDQSPRESAPTLHAVFIDTDEATARSIRRYSECERTPTIRSVATPLRDSKEYRDRDVVNLRSMSRRWIYNVPRSGTTEGMRPLGRLALIDHWKNVAAAITTAIGSLKNGCGDEVPRIYVVGSLAGGSASGMYLDVVHALRHMLDESGLAESEILSLMATTPMATDPSRPLALHNTHAALLEIRHFMQPGNGFPGDAEAAIPSVPAARSPLHDLYLIVGSESPSSSTPVETITEYVWLDMTFGGKLLASARETQSDNESLSINDGMLRTVGLAALDQMASISEKIHAPAMTCGLLTRWLGSPTEAKEKSRAALEKIESACGLSSEALCADSIASFGSDRADRRRRIMQIVTDLALPDLNDHQYVKGVLEQEFAGYTSSETAESDVQNRIQRISRELTAGLKTGELDIVSAIETLRTLSRNLRSTEIQLAEKVRSHPVGMVADTHGQQLTHIRLLRHSCDIGEQLFERHAIAVAAAQANVLAKHLGEFELRLSDAATMLAKGIRLVSSAAAMDTNPWETTSLTQDRPNPLIDELHEQSASTWLVNLIRENGREMGAPALVRTLNEAALSLIIRQTSPRELTQPMRTSTMEEIIGMVRPPLLDCGGQQRLVLIASTQEQLNGFQAEISAVRDGALTTVELPIGAPTLVHEGQGISVDVVASRLFTLMGGNTQVSDRLVTRTDITWSRPAR